MAGRTVRDNANHLTEAESTELLRLRALADPVAWTDRMLTALITGVKGGKWYSLMDKVCRDEVLESSFIRVKRNDGASGVDQVTIDRFEKHRAHHLKTLREELSSDRYRPLAVRRIYIPKPGTKKMRPLGIPTIRDRVAHNAIKAAIEPIFERYFSKNSYGFRKGLGCQNALKAVDEALTSGFLWVVDADVEGFFDNVDHELLMALVGQKVGDGKVLACIRRCLKQRIMDQMKEWTPDRGTPQGAVLSPLLANIYLDPLDKLMETQDVRMVRYADDFVVCCRTEEEALRILSVIREWMAQMKLTLHPEKTKVTDMNIADARFTFLGYEFCRTARTRQLTRWPSPKSTKKLRETIKPLTKRCNGHSIGCIIARIKPILRGWYNYFSDSMAGSFDRIDAWIRMRLRSILRKRAGRRGRGRGEDHYRWPNAYFDALGHFSLKVAHIAKLSAPSGSC